MSRIKELTKSQILSIKRYEEQYGLILSEDKLWESYTPIEWWKFLYYGSPKGTKIDKLPKHIMNKNVYIKTIIRYVLINELGYSSRKHLLKLSDLTTQKYKIRFHKLFNGSPLRLLQFAFPEYNIKGFELANASMDYWKNEDNMLDAMNFVMAKNNLTPKELINVENIKLHYNIMGRIFIRVSDKKGLFKSRYDLYKWFCSKHGIELCDSDFKTFHFKTNLSYVDRIKFYCENIVEDNIMDVIKSNDTNRLIQWVNIYFNSKKVKKYKLSKCWRSNSYDLLIEAYPEIIKNNLLFGWELEYFTKWHIRSESIKALKQLVLYRLNNEIKTLETNIPKYLRQAYLRNTNYSRFIIMVYSLYDSGLFYQWATDSFPEYKNAWEELDFCDKRTIAYDGSKCCSVEEMMLYEYLKTVMKLDIKITSRSKKFKYGKYIPDFIISGFNKPILIEYYGMYDETNKHHIYVDYVNKTKEKNTYYNRLNDVYFIDLYRDDICNNYLNTNNKITQFVSSINGGDTYEYAI